MILTADEVNRSLRGTLDLLNRRVEGLRAFDMSERGFWRSFAAILLTLPAYIVSLAFERLRLGILLPDRSILDSIGLDLMVGLCHTASFVALPIAMIWLTRALRLTERYVPFVIVTNWVTAIGLLILSVPAILLLVGWAPAGLATLFTIAFAVIVVRLQWFATKVTLGVSGGLALGIVALGLGLNFVIGTTVRSLIG
jgi:hypothetical protein